MYHFEYVLINKFSTKRVFFIRQWSIGEVSGFDLYRNLTPAWDVEGYITDVYTEEAKSSMYCNLISYRPLLTFDWHN